MLKQVPTIIFKSEIVYNFVETSANSFRSGDLYYLFYPINLTTGILDIQNSNKQKVLEMLPRSNSTTYSVIKKPLQ